MEFGTLGSVVGITVICYLASLAVKAAPLPEKWVCVICGALGGGLGVLGYFFMPDYPAGDVLSAIAVGIVSGMAALGGRRLMGREGSKKNEDGGKE